MGAQDGTHGEGSLGTGRGGGTTQFFFNFFIELKQNTTIQI